MAWEINELENGWLGNFDEWPILFFRNKQREPRYIGKKDLESGWIGETVHHTVLCYVCLTDLDWNDLSWCILSALPDIGRSEGKLTWLEHELRLGDADSFWEMVREALGGSASYPVPSETPNADWAVQNGIAPDQWFVLKLSPSYITYPATPDSAEEYDFEVDADLLDCEKLTSSEHEKRWSEFLSGKGGTI
jgi:hypothetical protein